MNGIITDEDKWWDGINEQSLLHVLGPSNETFNNISMLLEQICIKCKREGVFTHNGPQFFFCYKKSYRHLSIK